jgi:hypothetical protein
MRIVVGADGSWATRGYTAKCRQANLIALGPSDKSLVIVRGIHSAYCAVCDFYELHQPLHVVNQTARLGLGFGVQDSRFKV